MPKREKCPMVPTSVRLKPDTLRRIEAVAERNGYSEPTALYIRRAVMEQLRRDEEK